MTLSLRNALQEALGKFAREVLIHTYATTGRGVYEWAIENYLIRVVLPDEVGTKASHESIPFTLLYGGNSIGVGYFNIKEAPYATISELPRDEFLSELSSLLTRHVAAGKFINPQEIFKGRMSSFVGRFIAAFCNQMGTGTYEFPLRGYVLRVISNDRGEFGRSPFFIINDRTEVCAGSFRVTNPTEMDFNTLPPERIAVELNQILLQFFATAIPAEKESALSTESQPMAPTAEPEMLLNNMNDINDHWIEWYRAENPGTSYSKAVHAALTHINGEAKKFRIIIEKYSLRT